MSHLMQIDKPVNQRLNGLYARIPTFECKPGCHDCCGPVPWLKAELRRAQAKNPQKINTAIVGKNRISVAVGDNLHCPYIKNGSPITHCSCSVHSRRPLVCRLYGTVSKMICPHGCKPETMLTEDQQNDIMEEYFQLMEDEDV